MPKIKEVDLNAPPPMPDWDKLSKDRKDWFEVFGNQWAGGLSRTKRLTAEEREEIKKLDFSSYLFLGR